MSERQTDLLKSGKWNVKFIKALRHYGNKALRRNSSYCPIALSPYCLKRAFTLAEVLITLAIIGVIAAVTMPVLMTNINERVNSERQANIVYKINQAMEHMRSQGKLIAYDSTESFVNELQKHLKIQKVCDKDHLAECWPTEKVINGKGEEYNIADAKTSAELGLDRATNSNNVGLILVDGASLILNYDVNTARTYDVGDAVKPSPIELPVGNSKTREFAYSSSLMGPVSFVMDVNGKRGPNSEKIGTKYHDIREFGGASFTDSCIGDLYNGRCVYYVGNAYDPIDCTNTNGENYSYCRPTPSGWSNDRWAGAKYKCASIGMTLPNAGQLQSIYTEWNVDHSRYPSVRSDRFWTSDERSTEPYYYAKQMPFSTGIMEDNTNGYKSHPWSVLCVK